MRGLKQGLMAPQYIIDSLFDIHGIALINLHYSQTARVQNSAGAHTLTYTHPHTHTYMHTYMVKLSDKPINQVRLGNYNIKGQALTVHLNV